MKVEFTGWTIRDRLKKLVYVYMRVRSFASGEWGIHHCYNKKDYLSIVPDSPAGRAQAGVWVQGGGHEARAQSAGSGATREARAGHATQRAGSPLSLIHI